ncbi:Retinoblastoma-related protein [Nymphaea thermarum]|nr:Retinoblastoma-related protein [Nymphaea thermarum]
MGDGKPSVSSCNSQLDDAAMEARLVELCKVGLALDENMTDQAVGLFRESKHILLPNMSAIGSGSPEETERLWFAIVLYAVKRLSGADSSQITESEPNDTGFSLYQLLKVAKLNVVDFFKEMSQFCLKAGPALSNLYGVDWERRLQAKELQTNFVHLTVVSKYYKRAYMDLFLTSGHEKKPSELSGKKHYGLNSLTRLSLGLLLTSVTIWQAILIVHVPVRFRKFSLQDTLRFVRKSDKGVDLIASLCNTYHTSEDDLKKTIEKANNLIVEILHKTPSPASECNAESLDDIIPDGFTYFQDLMEDHLLSTSMEILEKDYEKAIRDTGELDERVFVDEEESIFGTGSLSGGAVSMPGSKRKYESFASPTKTVTSPPSPPSSPAASTTNNNLGLSSSKMAPTPVSITMTTAKWLRTVIGSLPPNPSSELQHFLSSCDRDLTEDIMRRANIILEAIFPSSIPGERCIAGSLQTATRMDSIWAEQRRTETLKLYYRVLVAMCRAESQTLHSSNLTSLLTNERFHRCMLACSAELVLATHKTVTMMFPAVLERTGITAFDLSKVIESFVRHEETLPRELKRHLNSLEERLLESLAWERGSSMYNSLIVAKPSLGAEINRLGLLAEPMPSLDAIALQQNITAGSLQPPPAPQKHETLSDNQASTSPKKVISDPVGVLLERNSFTSPVKERLVSFSCFKTKFPPPLQSAFASPTRPNPAEAGETCAETGINVFFRKVLKLAAIRIKSLCERLQQPNTVMESVYSLIQQILDRQTALFFNRHIDQLILCSLYGVSKISSLSLTFKEIIFNYRKQPQCKPQVFRYVFVDWPSSSHNGKTGQDHVDIITFYNELFVPAVKPLLVELGPAGTPTKTARASEENKTDGQAPGSPRVSLFPSLPDMSPKKVSASHNVYMETLISHNSKSYYACVGESTHAYQSPSKDLTAINNRLNSNRKVSGRLNFDGAGLVSDSLVAGSLYPQNGSSAPAIDAATLSSPLKRKQTDR